MIMKALAQVPQLDILDKGTGLVKQKFCIAILETQLCPKTVQETVGAAYVYLILFYVIACYDPFGQPSLLGDDYLGPLSKCGLSRSLTLLPCDDPGHLLSQ